MLLSAIPWHACLLAARTRCSLLLPASLITGGFFLLQHAVGHDPQYGSLLLMAKVQHASVILPSIPSLAAEPRCAQQALCCWATVQGNIIAAHVAVRGLLVHHQAAVGDACPLPEGGLIPVGRRSNDHCLAELAHCQNLQARAGER